MSSESKASRWQVIRILHWALVAGPVMFLVAQWFVRSSGGMDATEDPFGGLAPFLAAGALVLGIAMSYIMPTFLKKNMHPEGDATRALQMYQSLKIIQWALVEGPALFAGVIFFLTGEIAAGGASVILILYLLVGLGPSPAQASKWFGISEAELKGA